MGFGAIVVSIMGGLGPYLTAQYVDNTGSFKVPIYGIAVLLAIGVIIAILARPPKYALRTVKEDRRTHWTTLPLPAAPTTLILATAGRVGGPEQAGSTTVNAVNVGSADPSITPSSLAGPPRP